MYIVQVVTKILAGLNFLCRMISFPWGIVLAAAAATEGLLVGRSHSPAVIPRLPPGGCDALLPLR